MNSTHLRRLTMVLCLTGTTFMLAHSINAFVEYERAVIPSAAPSGPPGGESSPAPTETSETSTQFADHIKNSGLFALPTSPGWSPETGHAAVPPKPPLDVGKKVRLLGTILRDHGGSAILEDIASKQQILFHLHEEIPDIGEIRSITREGIVISQDGQEELLTLAILSGESASSAPSTPNAPLKPFAPPLKRTLDRRAVAEAVNDPVQLMMQAHAVPYLTHGILNGFRLDFVLPAGFFDKAGFQYGDVIQRVNGSDIRDPGRLLSIFKQLIDERIVKVDVVRYGQPTTLTYELR
jgi:general secretion pathway protein C